MAPTKGSLPRAVWFRLYIGGRSIRINRSNLRSLSRTNIIETEDNRLPRTIAAYTSASGGRLYSSSSLQSDALSTCELRSMPWESRYAWISPSVAPGLISASIDLPILSADGMSSPGRHPAERTPRPNMTHVTSTKGSKAFIMAGDPCPRAGHCILQACPQVGQRSRAVPLQPSCCSSPRPRASTRQRRP